MAEEIELETPKSSKIDCRPSTSKQFFDQKTPHSDKNAVHAAVRKRSRRSDGGDIWTSSKSRSTPLPLLSWANSKEVWQTMVYKEEATSHTRNCRLFEDPASFLPRMRAILVDWIMEVCEVYRLRRVTYYLAVDYIDRYLTVKPVVPKNQLQLIGISALFIAAKLEEIYPPKLGEFSYVCDGACSDSDILECEILLLNTLGWDVNPMTATGWLNLYMQIHFNAKQVRDQKMHEEINHDFFFPQYSAFQFVRASYLIDLFSLDPGFLLFSYSIIAAAAMYFLFGRTVALRVSGLLWDDLKDCTEYMAVFYSIVRDSEDPRLQTVVIHDTDEKQEATYKSLRVWVPNLVHDENHSVQTHSVDLKYFEKATLLRLQRMGLYVRKTYVKKNKLFEKEPSINSECLPLEAEEVLHEGNHSICEDEEPAMVMFEIKKMTSSELECDTSMPDNTSQVSNDDTDFFASKSRYTFDEILEGINYCTHRILLPHRLKHDI